MCKGLSLLILIIHSLPEMELPWLPTGNVKSWVLEGITPIRAGNFPTWLFPFREMSIPWDQRAPSERFDFIRCFEGKQLPGSGPVSHPTDSQDRSHGLQGFSTLLTLEICSQNPLFAQQKPSRYLWQGTGACAAPMLFWKQVKGNIPSMRSQKGLCQHRAFGFFLLNFPQTGQIKYQLTPRWSHHWVQFGRQNLYFFLFIKMHFINKFHINNKYKIYFNL